MASSVSQGDVGGAPDSLDGGGVDAERERERYCLYMLVIHFLSQ